MRFSPALRHFPARAGFWMLVLLSTILYLFFRESKPDPKEAAETAGSLLPLVRLLLQMGFFLLLAALAVALVSTLIAWAMQRHISARKAETLELFLDTQTDEKQRFQLTRTGSVLPFWGSVQTTLHFREDETTDAVALRSEGLFSFSKNSRQTAAGPLELRHTKEYRLQSVRFLFRDTFGLFALPITIPAADVFLRTPEALDGSSLTVQPRRAVELTERVNTMQRVEGDLYNSRRFATGDDMRRILWSVYARNRELMVRIPEIFEPYASVLTVFASFSARFPATFGPTEEATQTALDYYKSAVWTVYQNLSTGGRALHFRMAQTAPQSGELSKAEGVRHNIAAAHWDTAEPLPDAQSQVLVISSLTAPETLREMLDAFSGKRSVVLVRLSEAFNLKTRGNLLTRLLFRSSRSGKEARALQLRSRLLAGQLHRWEETLIQLLEDRDSLAALLPEKSVAAVAE